MKFYSLLFVMFFTKSIFSQCDTSAKLSHKDSMTRTYITNMNVEVFKGKLIKRVIRQKYIRKYCRKAYIQKIIGVLAGLELSYKGFITLRLYISNKDAQDFSSKASEWNFHSVKKIKVLRAEVLDYINVK
jgi:hypothetical protein